jgi:hypothetical protein
MVLAPGAGGDLLSEILLQTSDFSDLELGGYLGYIGLPDKASPGYGNLDGSVPGLLLCFGDATEQGYLAGYGGDMFLAVLSRRDSALARLELRIPSKDARTISFDSARVNVGRSERGKTADAGKIAHGHAAGN